MKKFRILFLSIIALGIAMSSCNNDDKDEEPTPSKPKPEVSFNNLPGYTFENMEMYNGQDFTVGIIAAQPDLVDITSIKVFRKVGSEDIELVEERSVSGSSISEDFNLTITSNETEVYNFKVINEYGEYISKTLTFTNTEAPVLVDPTIVFTGDIHGDTIIAGGESIAISISANQIDGKLKKFYITDSNGAVDTVESNISASYYEYTHNLTVEAGNTYVLTYTVTNVQDKSASLSITITGIAATPFAYENQDDGYLYHRWGMYKGAYNLVGNNTMSEADPDADKDMENTSINGGVFSATWESGIGNNTTFVKAEGYDYDNATVESAVETFANGDASNEITTEAVVGDIYIAKLRGTNEYCVIKVTEISLDDKSGTGYAHFHYKKTSETAGQ